MKSWGIFFIVLCLFACKEPHRDEASEGPFRVENRLFTTYDSNFNVLFKVELSEAPKRIIVLSTPHLSYLNTLQVENSIVGILGMERLEKEYLEAINIGSVQVDLEKVIALNPDLIICNSGQVVDLGRIKENIPVLVVDEYLSSTPLEKLSWITFFGEVFKKQEFARDYFTSEKSKYQKKDQIQDGILQLNCFSGKYYLPGCTSYITNLVKDAGGKLNCKSEGSNSVIVSEEESMLMVNQAEYVLFFDWAVDTIGIKTRLKPIIDLSEDKRLKVIYCNTTLTGFMEESVIHPSAIINDLNLLLKEKKNTNYFSLLSID